MSLGYLLPLIGFLRTARGDRNILVTLRIYEISPPTPRKPHENHPDENNRIILKFFQINLDSKLQSSFGKPWILQ